MQTIEFYSHEQQDEFIYNLFQQKQNGIFLDISCGNPIIGSNTYALERFCGWTGFGFDISNVEQDHQWSAKRTARFVQSDATSQALTDFLSTNIPSGTVVDYISLDVDANGTNLAFLALERVIASGIRFRAMTFEHEAHIHGDKIRQPARALLESQGYVRLFEDVRLWSGGVSNDQSAHFEDWWIDPSQFDPSLLEAAQTGQHYFKCVADLKEHLGNQYTATHKCSRAWPEEYSVFWNDNERHQLEDLFSQMTKKRDPKIKVYDCFTFYNEFDILEIRLEELWDSVDYFVIAEANTTHQSKPKEFLLKERWNDFAKYHSKIRHIMVEDMPCNPNTWVNENFQRRALARGLYDMEPEDLVIVGDGDEIVRPEVIELIKEDPNDYNRYVAFLPIFYFKLNYLMVNPLGIHGKAIITRGRAFIDPQAEREITFPWTQKPPNADYCYVNHAGWHFTYFGKTDFAKNKIQSFAHAETNIPQIVDRLDVDKMIERKVGIGWEEGDERFAYIHVDDYFPKTITDNLEKYQDMIVPGSTNTVYDFYADIELTLENLDEHINRTNGTFLQQYRRMVQL